VAIATCPKCATKLKVPDGTTASVRCPKCQTVFKTSTPPAAAPAQQFEVVDEPAPPAKTAPKPPPKAAAAPTSAPASKEESPFTNLDDDRPRKKKSRDDDDDDDRPRKKRSRDDDEDDNRPRSKKRSRDDDNEEDDRPRKKRSRDDDEDDDRPRSKKRSRDDDDDEDDDRPRKKSRDDDDEDDRPRKIAGSKLGIARIGMLLILISLGLFAATLGLQSLFILVALIGGVIPGGMSIITGLMGLVNWIVGLVGLGMCIAGPSRARGLAIAAVSVAGVHLILAFITANDTKSAAFSPDSVPELSMQNRQATIRELGKEYQKEVQKNPNSPAAKSLREELESYTKDIDRKGSSREKDSMRWADFRTFLPQLDEFILLLSYASKAAFEYGWYLLGFFTGALELARFILIALLLKSLASVAKVYSAESKAQLGWIIGASAVGAGMLILIVIGAIIDSKQDDLKKGPPSSSVPSIGPNTNWEEVQRQQQAEFQKWAEKTESAGRTMARWGGVGELLCLLLHLGSAALPAMAAMAIFSATKSGGGGGSRYKRRPRRDDDDDD
jgi:hypothetical protein